MQPLLVLLRARFRMLSASVLDRRKNAIVRNLSSAVVLLILMYAAYLFFHNLIFSYVVSLERIGFLLIERLISVTFLIFFIMLVISGCIMTATTLVKSAETEYLFSTPVPHRHLFMGKFLDIAVYGSWAVVAMALPILISYARAQHFGIVDYVLAGMFIIPPFVTAAIATGAVAAFCVMRSGRTLSAPKVAVAAGSLLALFLFAAIRFSRPNDMIIPFTEDFRALNIFINNFRLNSHPLTPNFWLIQSLRSLALHRYSSFLLYTAAIVTTALMALSLLYYLADRWYLDIWRRSRERSIAKRSTTHTGAGIRCLTATATSQGGALRLRDIRLFMRERGQWSQLAVMLVLIALYFHNIRLIPDDIDMKHWANIIAVINFGFCGFMIATMAIRFVFPSISLEGDAYWIVATAPVAPSTLFREKFWAAFTPFLILTELIALTSGMMLALDPFLLSATVGGIFLLSVALVAISVGFGAAFPEFKESSPSKIASGPGGLLAIATSLAYIGAVTTCFGRAGYLYLAYQREGTPFAWGGIAAMAVTALFLTAIAVITPLRMGSRALHAREL